MCVMLGAGMMVGKNVRERSSEQGLQMREWRGDERVAKGQGYGHEGGISKDRKEERASTIPV